MYQRFIEYEDDKENIDDKSETDDDEDNEKNKKNKSNNIFLNNIQDWKELDKLLMINNFEL